jgi:hypothetical protein
VKKQITLNAKQVKFTHELKLHDYFTPGGMNLLLRRCSTTKKFFELLDKCLPNQLLFNLEEQECYYLNEDRDFFKLKFEPVIMKNKKKNQTTEQYLEELQNSCFKQEIKRLAIPWNKFYDPHARWVSERYNWRVLTSMFIDLLALVKKKEIKVRCGIGILHLLINYPYYFSDKIQIGRCEINVELDFEVSKHDIVYDDVLLVGESIVEKELDKEPKENIIEEEKHKKKFFGLF